MNLQNHGPPALSLFAINKISDC